MEQAMQFEFALASDGFIEISSKAKGPKYLIGSNDDFLGLKYRRLMKAGSGSIKVTPKAVEVEADASPRILEGGVRVLQRAPDGTPTRFKMGERRTGETVTRSQIAADTGQPSPRSARTGRWR